MNELEKQLLWNRAIAALWRDGSYSAEEAVDKVDSLDDDELAELARLADDEDVQAMLDADWE